MSNQNSQFYLSPGQQDLLLAALSSNQQPGQPKRVTSGASQRNGNFARNRSQRFSASDTTEERYLNPASMNIPNSGELDFAPDESPYLDFDIDGDGDDNFDFDAGDDMIGEMPGSGNANDLHEKRKSIDGKDDDDEGGGKRQEGEDKSGKKPGRKPLTSEPTTKRKAQNRAAQRAFRERKEKHLKDLETKVEDLEKASESTNHENGLLRAQVEKLQVELKEYRKRLSWASNNSLGRSGSAASSISPSRNNNKNDFQFEFPKFGDLPGNHIFNNGPSTNTSSRVATLPSKSSWDANQPTTNAPGVVYRNSMSSSSPKTQPPTYGSTGNSPMTNNMTASPTSQTMSTNNSGSLESLTGLFSPSIIEASRKVSFDYFPRNNNNNNNNNNKQQQQKQTRNSVEKNQTSMQAAYNNSSVSSTDSPSSSTDSHHAASSIGTSPSSSLSSPNNKLTEIGLNTINEEKQFPNGLGGVTESGLSSVYDSNGFIWLAQQNGGGFDPVLFRDYRESQTAVVSQDFGTFFNDAFPLPDLGSPQHNFNEVAPSAAPKTDLMKQVDDAQQGDEEAIPGEDRGKLMTCNKIWDRLQSMEKFRNGEIDVDNLCAELRSKARCSGGGPAVDECEVDRILAQAK